MVSLYVCKKIFIETYDLRIVNINCCFGYFQKTHKKLSLITSRYGTMEIWTRSFVALKCNAWDPLITPHNQIMSVRNSSYSLTALVLSIMVAPIASYCILPSKNSEIGILTWSTSNLLKINVNSIFKSMLRYLITNYSNIFNL